MICQLTAVFLAWMGRSNYLFNTLKILKRKINNDILKSILFNKGAFIMRMSVQMKYVSKAYGHQARE